MSGLRELAGQLEGAANEIALQSGRIMGLGHLYMIAARMHELATPPAATVDAVAQLNAALGEAFKDDPANAVRAHAAVMPIIAALTEPQA